MDIVLGSPRGFCAGVVRAIDIVELALERLGKPIYIRHEIIHNQFIVNDLANKGAIFVDELSEVPDGNVVIFSAHGVSPSVRAEADLRGLKILDATCPLVTKVHVEAKKYAGEGFTIVLVGHKGHPETIGTAGEAPSKTIVVETQADIEGLEVPNPEKVVVLTQTTLSVDDTREIVDSLRLRFPNLVVRNDICYATSNRQMTAKLVAEDADCVLVIGAKNSSNSNRLKEVVQELGIPSYLIGGPEEIPSELLQSEGKIGIVSGASTPEILVQRVIRELKPKNIFKVRIVDEDIKFALPSELT
jgi:4-hydroxy-3-methylbut-2-enyl diphosphate reductase